MNKEKKSIVKPKNKNFSQYKVDLLMMEYEKCVETYLDLYNSVWKIFSYFSAITAAFLIFGDRIPQFTINLRLVLAITPLFYWWIGIYTPMNRYGELKLARLAEIETTLNELAVFSRNKGICHFTKLIEKKPSDVSVTKRISETGFFHIAEWMRVKYAANIMAIIIVLGYTYFLIRALLCLFSWNWDYFWDC